MNPLPCSIKEVYDAYEANGEKKVEENAIYLCQVSEIMDGRYLKMKRAREKALAPGRVRNKSEDDVKRGQEKWDAIHESMKTIGYDRTKPIEFIVRKQNKKRKLHQGHHRVTIAELLEIETVSVVFKYE